MAFLRARLTFGRDLALEGLGRSSEASERFGLAASDFEALGWLGRAAACSTRTAWRRWGC